MRAVDVFLGCLQNSDPLRAPARGGISRTNDGGFYAGSCLGSVVIIQASRYIAIFGENLYIRNEGQMHYLS